ncbi:hypothetical protein IFR05_006481 [Cadophora sp. M221]|nr:hypothetical protein IFR05_006481 [Cadophora sp. M221]
MSLEDLFERASDGPRQSGQLQRRLRLLQVVLPCFHDAVLQYYTSAKKFSGTKAFWTKVLTACLSMELGNWRFDWIDEGHSGLVKLVLERLETVVGLPAQDIADGFQYSPFRRLESIRQKSALSDGIDIELLKPETAKECDELVESLKLLSVVMQDKTKQPLPEDVRVASRPKSTVRIALPEPDVRQNTSVTDLCTTVKKSTARLNLNIEGALLSRQADTSLQMEHFEDCDLVKFCEGFLKNETELQIDGKVCLAVILSHAFLDFCGKPWFPEGWSKDSLYLMQRGESLFLQPFLVTNMHKESKISEAMKTSRADNLLRHGILLMEIFQQNPINGSLDSNGKPISLKDTADQVFKTIEWDICEPVLDTGIDLTNTWISQRAGRIQRWPVGEDCEDKDGHGTHVAHLLLRLAPHAQLHISKICKTRLLKDADVKRIAEAIVHFSTGKGRVDIISMSFGFPKYVTKLNPILSAIRTARTNGVIIFAAAGNEGGNRGVFWPAALHDGGNVIRINSSDGEGSPSGFNPSPERQRAFAPAPDSSGNGEGAVRDMRVAGGNDEVGFCIGA